MEASMRINMPITNVERQFGEEAGLISRTDTKGRITFINDAFLEVSGYSEEELIGQPHNIVRHPDMPEEAYTDLWNTIKDGDPWTALVKNRCKNGDHYWVEANVTPLREGNQITGFISIRNKPSSQACAAAEKIYHEIKEGTCKYTIKGGKLVPKNAFMRALSIVKNPSVKFRLGVAITLPVILLAIMESLVVSGAMMESQMAFTLAFALGAIFSLGLGIYTINSVVKPLEKLSLEVACAASGDFNRNVDETSSDEIGKVMGMVNTMNRNMKRVLQNIHKSTSTVTDVSQELAQGNADVSERIERQAASLEETAASMEELTSTVKQSSENATQANKVAIMASDAAMEGGKVVGHVVETMGSISESSKKIVDIISVIDGIAFQTNILALNAAVEAARAGEQGRGFAVVATEVRTLAQRSAAAAKEIKELINDSVRNVESGVELVDKTGKTMDDIVSSVKKVTDIMEEMSSASEEQYSGIDQVNTSVMDMDEVTQQNSALVEEAAAAAESMKAQAQALMQAVLVFKLEGVSQVPALKEHRSSRRLANIARLPGNKVKAKQHAA